MRISKKKKVLLLNPPSRKDVIRDYYCGHLSKGSYMWPPLDLLVISGHLYDKCDLVLIDATVMKFSNDKTIDLIKEYCPEVIVSLVSAVSWQEDLSFLKRVKQISSASIIISGDFSRAYPQKVLDENKHIDAIIFDFITCAITEYIYDSAVNSYRSIVTRLSDKKKIVDKNQPFSYSIPRHELFPILRYNLPHIYYHPFTTFLTTFGCMSACTFCPFERIPFKLRDIKNIEDELLYIKSLDIKELLFRDQSFGAHYDHAVSVCQVLKKINHPFSWSCEMRVNSASENLLKQMKEAGCHTIMFGVESADEEVLRKHKKGITLSQIRDAFLLAKKIGIRTIAHVMMGMDGEDVVSQEELIQFCLELDPHYVAFNIASPLWNTSFRDRLVQDNKILDSKIEVDSSYEYPVWESDTLSAEKVYQFYKKAIRQFYLRPSYILREFIDAKSSYRRRMMFKEGMSMLRGRKI